VSTITDVPRHGVRSGYTRGCRCEPCQDANRKWRKAYTLRAHRSGGKIRIDPAAVQAHIDHLSEHMSMSAIENASGVARSTMGRIRRGEVKAVHPSVAKRILAIRAGEPCGTSWVSAVGARRRVQALQCLGWSMPRIVDEVGGYGRQNLKLLIDGERLWITSNVNERIKVAYDRLSMSLPTPTDHHDVAAATKARNRAARNGWAPPLAWDDDKIDDPNATPYLGAQTLTPSQRHAENVADLLAHDPLATLPKLAERLGLSANGLHVALVRAGADGLRERLNRNAELEGHTVRRSA
jgi:hypothetical protein